MHDKQRSAALALRNPGRNAGGQLSGEGDGVQLDCPSNARRNWRSGSIDASVVALYGQIRHAGWRVSAQVCTTMEVGHQRGALVGRSFLNAQAASSSMSTATLPVVCCLAQRVHSRADRPDRFANFLLARSFSIRKGAYGCFTF